MPYHDPDHTDPAMRVGVGMSCSVSEIRDMAAAYSSELAQLGYGEEQIVNLFQSPAHVGSHLAWRALGQEEVQGLVKEAVAFWSHCRIVVREKG